MTPLFRSPRSGEGWGGVTADCDDPSLTLPASRVPSLSRKRERAVSRKKQAMKTYSGKRTAGGTA